ncbi:uncharacterized protein LOC111202405 [Brassica napus]|uniref:uncharacterized protein LOC111202405 n=1 Tax=Brassica napus TaxID=3708 RepID=UPI000BBE1E44|nr:uncharacterized protein LOC111202405 [Brassica napus]
MKSEIIAPPHMAYNSNSRGLNVQKHKLCGETVNISFFGVLFCFLSLSLSLWFDNLILSRKIENGASYII